MGNKAENTGKPIPVEICLGSSCYSRGNNEGLEILEQLIRDRNIEGLVELKGRLCAGDCAKGPCLNIGEKEFHGVHPAGLEDLLRHTLGAYGINI